MAAPAAPRSSLRRMRRAFTDWLLAESSRLDRLENRMSAQSDAFAELDAQLDAVEAYVRGDDAADAAQVQARTGRIRDLLAAVNPANPAPAPGDPGAVEPDPTAPAPDNGTDPVVEGNTEA